MQWEGVQGQRRQDVVACDSLLLMFLMFLPHRALMCLICCCPDADAAETLGALPCQRMCTAGDALCCARVLTLTRRSHNAFHGGAMRCLYMYTTVGEMAVLIFYAKQYGAMLVAAVTLPRCCCKHPECCRSCLIVMLPPPPSLPPLPPHPYVPLVLPMMFMAHDSC